MEVSLAQSPTEAAEAAGTPEPPAGAAEAAQDVPGAPAAITDPAEPDEAAKAVAGDLDQDDGEALDPAAEAESWREDAQQIRAERSRILAEAQSRIQTITAEANEQAARLEAEALEADTEAEQWAVIARRDAAIVAAEAEITTLTGARDQLTAEAAQLDSQAADLTARLAEFAAARAEAEQHRAMAARADDIAAAVAGVKDAQADLAAIAEAEQHPRGQLAAIQARLEAIRGEDGELATVTGQLGRAQVRLADLRREAEGLPPLAERQAVMAALGSQLAVALAAQDPDKLLTSMMALIPDEKSREELHRQFSELGKLDSSGATLRASASSAMAVAVLPLLAAWLDTIAAQSPGMYQAVKETFLHGRTPAADTARSLREELDKPAFAAFSDGTLRYEPAFSGWGRGTGPAAPDSGFTKGL